MQHDLQSLVPSPFLQLAQANMLLFISLWSPHSFASAASPMATSNSIAWPLSIIQGMSKNYVAFQNAFAWDGMVPFAGFRGGFVTLAQEL
jgi:hypothetical protein